MAILTTGNSYSDGNQITSSNLNAVVNSATFADPVDTSSGLNLTSDSPPKIAINTSLSNKVLTGGSLNNCPIGAVTPSTGVFTTLTATGNLDIDGVANLDAVDIDGAVQLDSTLTVGVNSTGYDVKFFGATSGAYMLWDKSQDDLILGGAARLGVGSTDPDKALVVAGAGAEIVIDDTDTTDTPRLRFRESGSTSGGVSTDAGELIFDSGTTERVRIDSSGKVGINSNNPAKLLHVKSSNSDTAESLAAFGNGDIDSGLEIKTNGNGGSSLDWGFNAVNSRNLVFDTNQTERMRISSTGNVGIGTTPSHKLDVNGTGRFVNNLTLDENLVHNLTGAGSFPGYSAGTFGAVLEDGGANGSTLYMSRKNSWAMYLATDTTLNAQSDKVVQFADLHGQSGVQDNITGSITITASATAFNTSSDYRLKENEVDITDGIDRLKELKPYRFNFTRDPSTTVDGFFAHEVSPVVPESINGEKDAVDEEGRPDYQGIDQSKLVPLLTAALQEAVAKIEALEARVQTLEG